MKGVRPQANVSMSSAYAPTPRGDAGGSRCMSPEANVFQVVMKSLQLAFALDALRQLEGHEVQTPICKPPSFP